MSKFARLAIAAAIATYVLIAVGGLVRATDSGLACPDWPGCFAFNDWIPAADAHVWIEHTHRLIAAIAVGPMVGAIGLITVFTRRRRDRALLGAAVVAGVLVIVQSILGRQVVFEGLARELVTAHLAMALTVLAMTILIADRAVHGPLPGLRSALPVGLIAITAAAVFGQMLLGSWVTGHDAGLAFGDFPLMNGSLLPEMVIAGQVIQFAHRAVAFGLVLLVPWMAWSVVRATDDPRSRRLAVLAVVLILLQVALGAANVWSRLSAFFVVPHLAVGAGLFATVFWLLLVALRLPLRRVQPASAPRASESNIGDAQVARGRLDTVRAYVALTKPRIIELLLVTTVPTMVLAARGIPSPWLMAAVVIGGTLAAGGANAINQFVDRDIDPLMRRTRNRPLPRHAVQPRSALVFGLLLSVAAFAWLTLIVNLLSALLAVSAIAFYVFVYTIWLKRSSPQNIVIGGAAGSVPVLVAWAAVTGEVGIPALVLFAIIFYWTPPHFWALALRYKTDYATARVPMMPVVRGEAETARQIVLYSLLLVAVSLLLLPAGQMGLIYLVSAVVLGVAFVWYALRILRDATSGSAAIGLFRFSIGYLTLLFAAVGADTLFRLPLV
ncbi:MAG TPA: heme o synthase [Candidatus Limnocylindrales bacterium]|nr:heme o synthase [Candidatus Limnocylindrales bacterium]